MHIQPLLAPHSTLPLLLLPQLTQVTASDCASKTTPTSQALHATTHVLHQSNLPLPKSWQSQELMLSLLHGGGGCPPYWSRENTSSEGPCLWVDIWSTPIPELGTTHDLLSTEASFPHMLCYRITKWCHTTLARISDTWVRNLSYWFHFESYTWDLARSARKIRTHGRQRWVTHTQNYPLVHKGLCSSTFLSFRMTLP